MPGTFGVAVLGVSAVCVAAGLELTGEAVVSRGLVTAGELAGTFAGSCFPEG
jgi:hypothetical protein